jgi:hypothetical protein
MQVGAETQPVPGNPIEKIAQSIQQGAGA